MYVLWLLIANLSLLLLPINSINAFSFTKFPDSPVITPAQNGWENSFVTAPSVVKVNSTFYMWYSGNNGTSWNIGLATSNDGYSWIKSALNPINIPISNSFEFYAPSVIHLENKFHMWLTLRNVVNNTTHIAHTTSINGIVWEEPNIIFSNTQPWESLALDSPTVIYHNNKFILFYGGNSGSQWSIGKASSSDNSTWTKYEFNPIISPNQLEHPTTAAPSVISNNNYFHIFYHSLNPPNIINYAYSSDTLLWNKYPNPVLSKSTLGFDNMYITSPSVLEESDVIFMYYAGYNGATWSIGVATTSSNLLYSNPSSKTILIPGFGASWNGDDLVHCNTNTDSQWGLFIAAYPYYLPLQESLEEAEQETLIFTYDWRKDVRDLAAELDSFIQDHSDPSDRIHIVAHSYGGLVARSYLETYPEHNVTKLITAGTPHEGLARSYPVWSAGEISNPDEFFVYNFIKKLAVKTCAKKYDISNREAIELLSPSIANTLSTTDYLIDLKSKEFISEDEMIDRNNYLHTSTFSPPYDDLDVTTLSGAGHKTLSGYSVVKQNPKDKLLGNWEDGRVTKRHYSFDGDGSVLAQSSMLNGAINIITDLSHNWLLSSPAGQGHIFDALDIELPKLSSESYNAPVKAIFASSSHDNFWLITENGERIQAQDNIIYIPDPDSSSYTLGASGHQKGTTFYIAAYNGSKSKWIEITAPNEKPLSRHLPLQSTLN